MNCKQLFVFTPALFIAPLVFAHIGPHSSTSFTAGFSHPFSGLDHLLALLALGLLAGRRGGKLLWLLPATFLTTMLFGGLLALGHLALPLIEPAIATSILILGVSIALARTVPPSALIILPALFALFHGHAHIADMPTSTSPALYILGLLAASALLLLSTTLLDIAARRLPTFIIRFTGAAIATCGLLLFVHLL